MALELPDYLQPLLTAYDITWPDIDEDAFHELQQPLRSFGDNTVAVSDAIESALRDLESGNPSQTLRELSRYFDTVRRDFLDPLRTVCHDLAGWPCETAYESVLTIKWTLIGTLTYEVGNDIVAIAVDVGTVGLGTALTTAEAVALREAIAEGIKIAEGELAGAIMSAASGVLQHLVEDLLQPFVNSVANRVESGIDSYAAHMIMTQAFEAERQALSGEDSLAGVLHVSTAEFESCVERLASSTAHLVGATRQLERALDDVFDKPAPNAPQKGGKAALLRMAAKDVMVAVKTELVAGIEQLLENVAKHFITILEDYKRDLQELDSQAEAIASRLHAGVGSPVSVLSAAGVGVAAAAMVVPTTGLIDAEAAEQIQVEAAVVVDDTETMELPQDDDDVMVGSAAVSDGTGRLSAPTPGPGVHAAPGTVASGPDELRVRSDATRTHAGLASAPAGPTTGVDAHRHGEPQRVAAAGPSATSGPAELHTRHHDEHRPHAGTAHAAGQGVHEVGSRQHHEHRPVVGTAERGHDVADPAHRPDGEQPVPVVDTSPAAAEQSD